MSKFWTRAGPLLVLDLDQISRFEKTLDMSNRNSDKILDDPIRFHQCRRLDGGVEAVNVIRRNGHSEIQFPPSVIEFPLYADAEESSEYRELLDEVCQNLNDIERQTWLKIIDGRPILNIADEEHVSRPAIYDRIRRMTKKNDYVAIWWRLKNNKTNQHK